VKEFHVNKMNVNNLKKKIKFYLKWRAGKNESVWFALVLQILL